MRRRSRARSGYEEQLVSREDEGLVLLQGAHAPMPAGRENRSCPLLAHERSELPNEALCPRLF
jgi:hypothetical protein